MGLFHATAAAAGCVSWKVEPELSLRHAEGWTMVQLRQDGDRLSGSAKRDGEAGAVVTGRLQPQRIWLKISWPGGAEIFEGAIGPAGEISGTRIGQDGRQDSTAWEAIEPLQCIAASTASAAVPGGSSQSAGPRLDEFTRAARDIIGILRGDEAQPAATPAPAGSASPAPADSADPFEATPAGGAGPTEQPPAGGAAGSTDPFEQAPAGGGGADSADPFGPLPGESRPPATPTGGGSRALPPSALEDRGIGTVRTSDSAKPATGKAMPMILIPIGPMNDNCAPGYVWREARPSDHVCVPPAARDRVKGENHFARFNRDTEGVYGCKAGYVWREAYSGDRACVSPGGRSLAAEENRLGPQRKASK